MQSVHALTEMPAEVEFEESGELKLEDLEITLVGAGRSGSLTALIQAMLGVKLRIYDPDRLGPENQALQLYRRQDIAAARFKVSALRSFLRNIVPDARIQVHRQAYTGNQRQRRSALVVLAVDTMETRRRIWEGLRGQSGLLLLLDVRLGRGLVRLHEVIPSLPEDVRVFESSLHDDASAIAYGDCGDEATTHASAAAAALIGGAVRAFVEGLPRPRWLALDLDRGQWAASPLRQTRI